jgi:hypothetical protein
MGMSSSQPSGTQQVVNKSEPWEAQKPVLERVFNRAEDLYNTPQKYFSGNTVIPFSAQTQQAITNTQNIANSQMPTLSNNINQINKTINGDYLYGGDGFNNAFDAASRKIMPLVNSQAAAVGQNNSSARDRLMTQTLADAFASQYGQERQNQLAAQNALPQLMQSQYLPQQQLLNVGGMNEQMAGQQLQDQINRYNFAQQEPANRLAMLSQFAQGNYGGSQTSSAPLYSNPAAGGLGGALAGAKIGSAIPGLGTGLGAALGGLGGLLFG